MVLKVILKVKKDLAEKAQNTIHNAVKTDKWINYFIFNLKF